LPTKITLFTDAIFVLSLLCDGYLQRALCALRRFVLSASRFAAATVLRFLRVLPEGIAKFWR